MGANFSGKFLEGSATYDAVNVELTGSSATVTADTELPDAALLADDTGTPTAPAVGSFGMVFDGSTWDLMRGTSADGVLVNLGTNNDVTVTGTVTADTELPTAAALTDDFANPTAPAVGSFGMLWDGATWDRAPGTSAGGTLVNLGTNNDVTITDAAGNARGVNVSAENAASVAGDIPQGTADAGAPVKIGGRAQLGALDTVGDNARVDAAFDRNGRQYVSFFALPSPDGRDPVRLEDAGHTSGDAGLHVIGVRRDADTTPVSGDNDYHPFLFGPLGGLKSNLFSIGGTLVSTSTGNSDSGTQRVAIVSDQPAISVGHDTTGTADGRKVISSAGTAEALATSTAAKWVIVSAETDNTNPVTVGGATVVGALATRRGTPLFPGDSVSYLIDDLDEVFVDVITSGEGVTFAFGT